MQNLENVCLDNVFMLYYNKKSSFKNYVMAYNTNKIYNEIAGDELAFLVDYPDIYKKIEYYKNFYSYKLMRNIFIFQDIIINYGKIVNDVLTDSFTYSVGFLTAYYLDYYKEKENTFNDIHKKCYDSSLLYGLDVSCDKVSKVLKKEINSIR